MHRLLQLSLVLLVLDRGVPWYYDPRRGNAPDHVIVYTTRWCPVRERLRRWLGPRLGATVAAVRFLPGLRFPVYTACGFLGMPLARFTVAVICATVAWTTLLFALSFAFGAWAAERIGVWRMR